MSPSPAQLEAQAAELAADLAVLEAIADGIVETLAYATGNTEPTLIGQAKTSARDVVRRLIEFAG